MGERDGGQVAWLDELVKELRSVHDEISQGVQEVCGEHTSSVYAACAMPPHVKMLDELLGGEWHGR
jgi:hypothetical protein